MFSLPELDWILISSHPWDELENWASTATEESRFVFRSVFNKYSTWWPNLGQFSTNIHGNELTSHIWILNKNLGAEIFSSIHNQDIYPALSRVQRQKSGLTQVRTLDASLHVIFDLSPFFICEKFKETLKLRMQSLQLEESVKFDFWTTHTYSTWRTKQWQS